MTNTLPLDIVANIGVFDSGVGGLTVLNALFNVLPQANYFYLGDTLHMPYGGKTQEELVERAQAVIQWLLMESQPNMLVVGCNSTAGVLKQIQSSFPTLIPPNVQIFEPIFPACQAIAQLHQRTPYKNVGLLATHATVQAGRYQAVLNELNPAWHVLPVACPGLADIIEEGKVDSVECEDLVLHCLRPFLEKPVDVLILGCTHYPLAKQSIQRVLKRHGLSPDIVDPAFCLAQQVLKASRTSTPRENVSLQTLKGKGTVQYYVTLEPQKFYKTLSILDLPALAFTVTEPSCVKIPGPLSLAEENKDICEFTSA